MVTRLLSLVWLVMVLRVVRGERCVESLPVSQTRLLLTGLTCTLSSPGGTDSDRGPRQAFYGDTDVPVLKFDPNSSEGAKIAQQISALFREGGGATHTQSAGFAEINRVNMTVRDQQGQDR